MNNWLLSYKIWQHLSLIKEQNFFQALLGRLIICFPKKISWHILQGSLRNAQLLWGQAKTQIKNCSTTSKLWGDEEVFKWCLASSSLIWKLEKVSADTCHISWDQC